MSLVWATFMLQAHLISSNLAPAPPNSYACQPGQTRSIGLPFCNPSLPRDQRVRDLIGRLTLAEKLGLLHAAPGTDACAFTDSGVARLDIPPYSWTEEANTGADSSCIGPEQCTTTFSSPALLAATFNRTVWRHKGEVISTEVRALNNVHGHRGCGKPPALIGVDEWGPNINLMRDQRFGRNSELPSEDPFLTGRYAVEYVKGLQEGPDPNYTKVAATLKHFTAYSVEDNRGHDNANISKYDLTDSYLRQYEMGFVEGKASGAMCSYNLINGVPNCASPTLLNRLVRGQWGREDAVIVSDCGALGNMMGSPTNWDPDEVVANVFNAGLDLNTGNEGKDGFSFSDAVTKAMNHSMLNTSTLDKVLSRSLAVRFQGGAFDPLSIQQYTEIGAEMINATEHWHANLEAASQGLVLLTNGNASLPLGAGIKLAVVGPHAVSNHGLFSDSTPTLTLISNHNLFSDSSHVWQTIGAALTLANAAGETRVEKGVDITGSDTQGEAAALEAVSWAEAVVLGVGTDVISVEREGHDRSEVGLPTGLQSAFAEKVMAAAGARNIPVILLVLNGGAVSIDTLMQTPYPPASIVEAFFPGQRGAEAIANHLFGMDNRWGKLPYSILTTEAAEALSLADATYSMVNRTYRYAPTRSITFPFGYGLSYTTFALTGANPTAICSYAGQWQCNLTVTNTGDRVGDAIVTAFFVPITATAGQSSRRLQRQLWGFERITLDPAANTTISFILAREDLALVSDQGERVISPGIVELQFSLGDRYPAETHLDVRTNVTIPSEPN